MKNLLVTLAISALCAGAVVAAEPPTPKIPVGLPPDAQFFSGKWYRVYPGKETWTGARQKCLNLGGNLAVVPDEPTYEFLKKIANHRTLWLGATVDQSGLWKWIDGSPMKYTAWLPGQPSNFQNHEKWLAMGKKGWFDIDQKSSLVEGFVCEWKR